MTLEVPAPKSGVLQEIKAEEGTVVNTGQVLAIIAEGDAPAATDEAKVAEDTKTTEVPMSFRYLYLSHGMDGWPCTCSHLGGPAPRHMNSG